IHHPEHQPVDEILAEQGDRHRGSTCCGLVLRRGCYPPARWRGGSAAGAKRTRTGWGDYTCTFGVMRRTPSTCSWRRPRPAPPPPPPPATRFARGGRGEGSSLQLAPARAVLAVLPHDPLAVLRHVLGDQRHRVLAVVVERHRADDGIVVLHVAERGGD